MTVFFTYIFNPVHYCILCCDIAFVDKSPVTKSHKSRFAALAETINSWEDEVTPPSAKSVID